MLAGIVFFITGCNSLISQFFGTHKLRTFTAEEVAEKGVGDADFVEISNVWLTGDYLIVPPRTSADRAVLIYPAVTQAQLALIDSGAVVAPLFIAWTRDFDASCDNEQNCIPRQQLSVRGVVREMNPSKNRANLLPAEHYHITGELKYVEAGRAPLPWYWNLLMMVGGIGLAVFYEYRKTLARRRGESA
jgi:hypothetical protein